METESTKNGDDIAKEISYWGQEFEKITKDYSQLLKNENELYQQQLEEITKNHQYKLSLLNEWKENSEYSIEKDRELKIQYFKEDCEIKKAEIPIFMKQSIQKQFSRLKNEFSDVFDLFLQQDIPFINEFSSEEKDPIYEVDLNKHSFLSASEIKEDENNFKNNESSFNSEGEYRISYGELKSSTSTFHVGSECSVQFEKMTPVLGKISKINDYHSTIEFTPTNGVQPITFSLQALNIRIIKIKNT